MNALRQRLRRHAWVWAALATAFAIGGALRLQGAPAEAHSRVHAVRAPAVRAPAAAIPAGTHWLASWAAAPQAPAPGNLSRGGFRNQTLREIAFLSTGGSSVQVRLTNQYGSRPLQIGRAAVGLQAAGAGVVAGTNRALTFGGQRSLLIPPGGQALSDPVRLRVPALSRVAVAVYLPRATGPVTQHYEGRQVNYVAHGDRAYTTGSAGFTGQTQSWYLLDGVDVLAPSQADGAIVALGDSITDGVGSVVGTNSRWPNGLARRLAALHGATMSVVDEGIGGNRVLNNSACCGVNAVARLGSDVFDQPGVRDVILLEGINDIGFTVSRKADNLPHTNVSALQIVQGYEQIIAQAHAAGLKVFGGTLLPFKGARYWTPAGEAKRDAVNRWIRTSGAFDGVIDFATVVADPGSPQRLNPAYDSGDHLHPDGAGYRVMANAVDLPMLGPGL